MTNERIEQSLADALLAGSLMHPGNPAERIPPRPIVTPFAHAAGRPKEMNDLMDATAKLWSEAIVHHIETETQSEIVGREEAIVMRRAVGEGPPTPSATPVFCKCDSSRSDPLALLTITNPDYIVIDGPTLIKGLTKRAVNCPHKRG